MIYLDNIGHLWSDESFWELYSFGVRKLKMKPQWNHYSRHFPHFDLTTDRKKDFAIALGAKPVKVRSKEDTKAYDDAKAYFKDFYEKNKDTVYWYESKGLMNQKIFRVNFPIVLELEGKYEDD